MLEPPMTGEPETRPGDAGEEEERAFDLRAISPSSADATGVRLLPDGEKIVYVVEDDGCSIFVENPTSGWKRRIASYPDHVSSLAVSPGGDLIAYLLGSAANPPSERRVAWARTSAPREAGRAPGAAFGFGPTKPSLYVVDGAERALVRHDPLTGKGKRLADVPDDAIATFPAEVVVGPDATRIAVVSRRALEDLTEVWIVSPEGTSLLTQVPGAQIFVYPFWSKGGKTLGLHIIHPDQEQSAILVIPKLEGDGEMYYRADSEDGPVRPAWSPSSRYLAFFPRGAEPLPCLSLLDLETRKVEPILDPGEAVDTTHLRFLDDRTLILEGGSKAHVLTFETPL